LGGGFGFFHVFFLLVPFTYIGRLHGGIDCFHLLEKSFHSLACKSKESLYTTLHSMTVFAVRINEPPMHRVWGL
jgi:hypothetical protein